MAATEKKRVVRARPKARRKGNFEKLDEALEAALDDYVRMLGDNDPDCLHKLVSERVEKKLIEHVLTFTKLNQTHAAAVLGISRSTLRSKIRAYGVTVKKKSR